MTRCLSASSQDVKAALDVKTGRQPSLADDDFYLASWLRSTPTGWPPSTSTTARWLQAMVELARRIGALRGHVLARLAEPVGFGLGASSSARYAPKVITWRSTAAQRTRAAKTCRHCRPTGTPAWPSGCPPMRWSTSRRGIRRRRSSTCSTCCVHPSPSASRAPDMSLQSIGEMLGTPPQDYLDFVQDVGVSRRLRERQAGSRARRDGRRRERRPHARRAPALGGAPAGGGKRQWRDRRRAAARRRDDHGPPREGSAPALPGTAALPGGHARHRARRGRGQRPAAHRPGRFRRQRARPPARPIRWLRTPKFQTAAATARRQRGHRSSSTSPASADALEQAMPAADRGRLRAERQAVPGAAQYVLGYGAPTATSASATRLSLRRVTCAPTSQGGFQKDEWQFASV